MPSKLPKWTLQIEAPPWPSALLTRQLDMRSNSQDQREKTIAADSLLALDPHAVSHMQSSTHRLLDLAWCGLAFGPRAHQDVFVTTLLRIPYSNSLQINCCFTRWH